MDNSEEAKGFTFSFTEFNVKTLYREFADKVRIGEAEGISEYCLKLSSVFSLQTFSFTISFDELNVLELMLALCNVENPETIRNCTFSALIALVQTPTIKQSYLYRIIEYIANFFPNFQDPLIEHIYTLLSLICAQKDDYQQKILATLQYKDIYSLVSYQLYKSEDQAKAAFSFVGSTFQFPTSEKYASCISQILSEIGASEYKSYLIYKVVGSMPEMVNIIGENSVMESIYCELGSVEAESNIRALEVLAKVIKIKKGELSIDFAPVFAKLSSEDVFVSSQALFTLSILAQYQNGARYLIDSEIFSLSFTLATSDAPAILRIESLRLIANIITNMTKGEVLEFVSQEIIQLFCDFIDHDDPSFVTSLLKALNNVLNSDHTEMFASICQQLEENETWDTIQQLMDDENTELQNAASMCVFNHIPVEDPDEQ